MTYKVILKQIEQGYSVGCPELPGCRFEGETKDEAIANIREAIQEYLSVHPKDAEVNEVRFVEAPQRTARYSVSNSTAKRAPFVVTPIANGLPAEWTSHKVEDLLTILEGPAHR